jgi:hypothetical protein
MDDTQSKAFVAHMRNFLGLCQVGLGLTSLPRINWLIDQGGVENRTFGQYVPSRKIIEISIRDRHPLDIMRTLAHELIHYKQHLEGRLKPGSGKTGSGEENEANSKAGVIMRNFNRKYPDAFEMQPLNNTSD